MKFGNYLAFYMIPEWRKHYINYLHLKKILKQLSKLLKGKPAATLERKFGESVASMVSEPFLNHKSTDNDIEMEVYNSEECKQCSDSKINKRFVVSLSNEQLSDEEIVIKQWIHEYTANVDNINSFYLSQIDVITNKLEELKMEIQKTQVILQLHG
eukprot:TRINITY_DN1661_c0_g2_i2.p1 TRINITY_DN1661_c0_g2~~TRINITY_DN1661_c0_g2_i2.p1  ORF type:complete len:156 (-),score=42.40 TRINITY_DN1661_c0_g2_i2:578-1045(-)